MKLFWLLLFTVVISLVTHDGVGRRRARAASKYDLNPQLTIAENRTTYEAREEQRDREAWFGWDDDDDDERTREEPSVEDLDLPADVVRVASFRDAAPAHLLRGRLESVGVAAVVTAPLSRPPVGSHEVYVSRERVAEALEVMAELRQSWSEQP